MKRNKKRQAVSLCKSFRVTCVHFIFVVAFLSLPLCSLFRHAGVECRYLDRPKTGRSRFFHLSPHIRSLSSFLLSPSSIPSTFLVSPHHPFLPSLCFYNQFLPFIFLSFFPSGSASTLSHFSLPLRGPSVPPIFPSPCVLLFHPSLCPSRSNSLPQPPFISSHSLPGCPSTPASFLSLPSTLPPVLPFLQPNPSQPLHIPLSTMSSLHL